MSEVNTWSPIDESNTAAPPNGWPENMQPSAVNNCARAMMGAIRRFHDNVNSNITNISNALSAFLPLSGGTVTGNLTVNGALVGANTISTTGPNAAYSFADRAGGGSWIWYATGGIARLWMGGDKITIDTGGTITAVLDINAGRNAGITGTLFAGSADISGNLAAAGTVSGDAIYSSGEITAVGTITGNIVQATGTVSGNAIYSAGDLTAVGTITGGTVSATGTVSGNLVTANVVSSNNHVNASSYNLRGVEFAAQDAANTFNRISDPGGANITLFASGSNYYDNVQHFFRSRGGVSNYCFFHGGGTFNVSGSWSVISDDTVKTNVAPYTAGLAQVKQLNPVSFEYTQGAALRGAEGTTNYGLMASEVQPVIPEMVSEVELNVDGTPTPTQTLMPTHLVYCLINAVKELSSRVEALEGAR